MAAIFAASAGAETLLLERTRDGGRKILISGGGRCNILPGTVDERRFVTDSSPNTLRKILRSWPLEEQVAFFERELGLPLIEEEASAKLFPVSNRARDVRDGLLALAGRRGARFLPQTPVTGLAPTSMGWAVEWEGASPLRVDAVVVASGGLSVPTTGSDGGGLRMLAALGHTIHPTYPALTPIVAEPAPFGALAGISLPVTITARDGVRSATAEGGFLFTHRGLQRAIGAGRLPRPGPLADRGRRSGPAGGPLDWTGRCRLGDRPQGGGNRHSGGRSPAAPAGPARRRRSLSRRGSRRPDHWPSSAARSVSD